MSIYIFNKKNIFKFIEFISFRNISQNTYYIYIFQHDNSLDFQVIFAIHVA